MAGDAYGSREADGVMEVARSIAMLDKAGHESLESPRSAKASECGVFGRGVVLLWDGD